jgi:hypothetical protein
MRVVVHWNQLSKIGDVAGVVRLISLIDKDDENFVGYVSRITDKLLCGFNISTTN